MTLDSLQTELTGLLKRNGVQAMSAWPENRRASADGPVVLVSLEKLSCASAGLQDYLGETLDESTGQWRDLYGRRAQLTFTLDILASPRTGAQACREVFDQLVRCLQTDKPAGLSVRELDGEELKYDEKEGLLNLRCRLKCEGWLCTTGDEAGTFLNFTLRGDINA